MQRFSTLLFSSVLFVLPYLLSGQVQKVKYFMKYNDATCLFDFCFVIKEGQATTMQQRVQMNAQYTVVVPAGSVVELVQKYNPLQSNQNYTGTIPMDWQLGSTVFSPAASPESDFYSIVPTLSPTSFYNNIYTNDTVRLFSLSITPIVDCGKGIRIFDNQNDPGPLAPGMNGSNFSNGFTIGGIQNRYDGNETSRLPRNPVITNIHASCASGLELNIEAHTHMTRCQRYVTYEWKGPEGFYSTLQNVSMPDAGPLQKGMYYVKVQDSLGCSVLDSVQAYVKPDAGKDKRVGCYQTGVATLIAKGTGEWSFASDNPGTAQFSDEVSRITNVYGFSDPGQYQAIWTSSGCSDTVRIEVQSQCACAIQNTLEIPGVFLFCGQANNVMLTGNEVTDQGNYTWLYSVNNASFEPAPGLNSGKNYMTSSLGSGEYSFKRVFTRSAEPVCSDTSNTIYLIITPELFAGQDVSVFCYSTDTVTLQASGNGVWSVLHESAGPLNISQFGNPVQQFQHFSQAGNYLLTWSNESCIDTVTIHANPFCGCHEAKGGNDLQACAKDTVVLSGTCLAGTWRKLAGNPPGDTLVSDQNGVASIAFGPGAMGEYFYQFIVFDTLFDTVKITVHSLPVINAGEDFGFCEGSPPVLLVAGGGVSYLWSTGETATNILVSPTQTSTYHVFGYNQHGCEGVDSITVSILPKPQGSIPELPVVSPGSFVILQPGTWSDAVIYIWQGPNGFTSTLQSPVLDNVTLQHAGNYILTVISGDDCISTGSVNLVVDQNLLPVKLVSFSGEYQEEKQRVVLNWVLASQVNHHYFQVERTTGDSQFENAGVVYSDNKLKSYQFEDQLIEQGKTYQYRLVSYDLDGTKQIFGPLQVKTGQARQYSLHAYPVPFQDKVFVKCSGLDEDQHVIVEVFSMSGQLMYSEEFAHYAQYNILQNMPLINFVSGVYRVVVHINEEKISFPIIKSN